MKSVQNAWDWLIVTASSDIQARAYQTLLESRQGSLLLNSFVRWQVVSDPQGRRVGSGGSTLLCLKKIASALLAETSGVIDSWEKLEEILRSQRVMIVHAGGDSRRLPAYAPCGKLFVPVPDEEDQGGTLFDRLLSSLSQLPKGIEGQGQYLVVSGDALLLYRPEEVHFEFPGLCALGVASSLEECSRHGVLCANPDQSARLYLQKPSLEMMRSYGAVLEGEKALLDAGLMSFDARFACGMMKTAGMELSQQDGLCWNDDFYNTVLEKGLDLYREICCALGCESTFETYLLSVRKSGSSLDESDLRKLYDGLKELPLFCLEVSRCDFLHFGMTRQLITSAEKLCQEPQSLRKRAGNKFILNTAVKQQGLIHGEHYWVEGCRVNASITLEGENVLTGVSFDQESHFSRGCCLDEAQGQRTDGTPCWFVRPYGIEDSFKDSLSGKGTFCNLPLREWIAQSGVKAEWIWDDPQDQAHCTLWNAKLFPACARQEDYRDWLWYFHPSTARENPELLQRFLHTPRYDCGAIAQLSDLAQFHQRRLLIRKEAVQ